MSSSSQKFETALWRAYAKGLPAVMRRMNKEVSRMRGVTNANLIKAGLFIQGEAQKIAPVDTGNLRNSGFTYWGKDTPASNPSFVLPRLGGAKALQRLKDVNERTRRKAEKLTEHNTRPGATVFTVVVGFGAFYALHVHEDARRSLQRGAKFLQRALVENASRIYSILTGK